jgi:hypothetical protein
MDRSGVAAARKRLDTRLDQRRAMLKAREKDVVRALRIIRDAARRGDPKALAVIAFCVSPFT